MPRVDDKLPVFDSDLAKCRESGLTDETIEANGLRTDGDALEFRYRNLDGKMNCFTRRRPHHPRIIDDKPVKYEQPKGSALRAYYPAASLSKLRDGVSPLFLTEGELKALALSQLGLAAVGIGGIWCGCKKDSEDLIDDLAAIPWAGRTVFIVFDHDTKPDTRRQVHLAQTRLAGALRRAGAGQVFIVDLPPGPGGVKQGVDDFLVANGAEAYLALVEQSRAGLQGVDAMDLMNSEMPERLVSLPLLGVEGYVIECFATVLSAPPKGGKTELMHSSLNSWLELGATILYFSEEPELVWRHRLKGQPLINRRGLTLVFGMGKQADELLDRAKAGSETVVVIDTLRGLGILPEEENDNGAVARAMEPWLTACREGAKTFLGLHHDRKSGGKHGQGVSGAHSLVGAVDMLLQIERGSQANQRVVTAIGRLVQPAPLTYERLDDGRMVVTDAPATVPPVPAKAKKDLLALLPTAPPGLTLEDLVREARVAKMTAHMAMQEGITAGQVKTTGGGKKGDPNRYLRVPVPD